MTINKTKENGKITFALEGRLDVSTAPMLQDALIPAFNETKEVVIDFKKLTHLYTDGLRVLLIAQKEADAKGVDLTVVHVSKSIMQILVMTNFVKILNIV